MSEQVAVDDPVIAQAFAVWRKQRATDGRAVTLIDLYTLVASQRGVEPHALERSERARLARLAFSIIWLAFETIPGSERGAEPVEVVPYDTAWAALFGRWRARIAEALGAGALAIEHVGSTAIPGLHAKPIVDIQVSVADLDDEPAYVPALASIGLQLRSRDRLHRYLRPLAGHPREVHVHVCAAGGGWEREHLLLRDYLRADPDTARTYGTVKQELAIRWREDTVAYGEAKSGVVLEALRAAEEWATRTGWSVAGAPSPGA